MSLCKACGYALFLFFSFVSIVIYENHYARSKIELKISKNKIGAVCTALAIALFGCSCVSRSSTETAKISNESNAELNDKVFDSTESNKKSIKIEDLYYTALDEIDFFPGIEGNRILHMPVYEIIKTDNQQNEQEAKKNTNEDYEIEEQEQTITTVWENVVPASYGSRYRTISCSKIGLYSSLIWGDDQNLLDSRSGVCQYTGSSQVGYGGCHLLCAHNNGAFSLLQYVSIGDEFVVDTDYGRYVYKVDSCRAGTVTVDAGTVIAEDGTILVNLGDSEDSLYMYTCYPFGYYQSTPQRYVVRAKLVA